MQKPRGTEDIFGKKAREFIALKLLIRNNMDLFNIKEIETPMFESLELFKRGVGEDTDVVSKEMFTFTDRKDREFALRPEGTAPTVRSVVENKLYIQENLPLKLFYIGQMFRYERPQAGRQRQFNQLGVEFFGPKNAEIDAEVITLGINILKNIGIDNTKVHLNYLVSGEERKTYINDLKDYFKTKTLCDDCKVRMEHNPLRVLDCKIDGDKFDDVIDMKDYLSNDDKTQMNKIVKILSNIGIDVVLDKLLVRGLDYYTGFVFEIKSTDPKQGSQSTLLGGGRYDNLVNQLGGPELPACGFGMGLERIMISLENLGIDLAPVDTIDAYIIGLSEKANEFSQILMQMIRTAGLSVDYNFMNRNLKSAFKQAEKANAKNIILIGDKELQENVVVIKNQITNNESKVKFDQIINELSKEN